MLLNKETMIPGSVSRAGVSSAGEAENHRLGVNQAQQTPGQCPPPSSRASARGQQGLRRGCTALGPMFPLGPLVVGPNITGLDLYGRELGGNFIEKPEPL